MRRKTNACFPKIRGPNIGALPRSRKLAKAWILALRARLPAKNGDPRKGRRRDRKSVPPTTARAPAGMTVRLKIRGPGEPRKPKAGTPERNKTRLNNYPPFRGIFITPVYIPVEKSADGSAKVVYRSKDGRTEQNIDAFYSFARLVVHFPNRLTDGEAVDVALYGGGRDRRRGPGGCGRLRGAYRDSAVRLGAKII